MRPCVYLSYAPADDAFAQRLAADLRAAPVDVMLSPAELGALDPLSPEFFRQVNDQLDRCQMFVLVLSPAALASKHLDREAYLAIGRTTSGLMRPPLLVAAAPVVKDDLPALWRPYPVYDATGDHYGAARDAILAVLTALNVSIPLPTRRNTFEPPALSLPLLSTLARSPRARAYSLAGAGALLLLLLLSGLLPGSDWAAGILRAGVAGLLSALIALTVLYQAWQARILSGRRAISLLLAATLLLATLSAAGLTAQSSIHDLQARFLLDRRDFAGAAAEFSLAGEPAAQARTLIAWGRDLSSSKQYEQAIAKFEQARTLAQSADLKTQATDGEAAAYLARAQQLHTQAQYEQAIAAFDKAHALGPSNDLYRQISQAEAVTYLDWGQQLQAQGQYDAAIARFSSVFGLLPSDDIITQAKQGIVHSADALGKQLSAQGQYESAYAAFKKVLDNATDPTDIAQAKENLVKSGFALARQLRDQGHFDQAIAQFTDAGQYAQGAGEVAQVHEEVAATYLAWGNQLLSQSNYDDAITTYAKVLDDPDTYQATAVYPQVHQQAAKAYLARAQQSLSAGSCFAAQSDYATLVAQFGDTPEAQTARAALSTPQNVTGKIVDHTSGQPAPNVQLFLSANWDVTPFLGFTASDDYTTFSDAGGNFTFVGIPPQEHEYLISYIGTDGAESITTVSSQFGLPHAANTPSVQGLCPVDAGTVDRF